MTAPVKRYNMDVGKFGNVDAYESEHGRWVKRDDFDRLEQERAEQWRLRRDAEADQDTKAAVIAELKDELDNLKRSWGLLHSENESLRADKAAIDLLNQYIVTAADPDTGKTVILADSGTLRDCMATALQAKP